CVQGTHWPYSF
nr:immunoglobulin light chain junction region [Macaca mulatta]MOW65006.1 immunoglobulin light chain junction region [Macaca mulatta]MOW65453.1 immunoglobulin light chain junction region [Macaca mulatta]MOW73350.1 immunoglobulin light chain junction region [Macaca mulatta]MOX51467.1 immunoglobulin light chain junction region [Macaca mulatta]